MVLCPRGRHAIPVQFRVSSHRWAEPVARGGGCRSTVLVALLQEWARVPVRPHVSRCGAVRPGQGPRPQ